MILAGLKAQIAPYAQMIKTIFIVAFIAAVFYGGWKLKDYQVANKENKELKEAIKQRDELQAKYDALSERVVGALERNDAVQEKVIERTYREIEKPVYKDCILPASGVQLENEQRQLLNAQIAGDKPRVE